MFPGRVLVSAGDRPGLRGMQQAQFGLLPTSGSLMAHSQVGSVHLVVESSYPNRGGVAATSDEIHYTYTITNNGLLTLYDIAVRTEAPMAIVCVDTDDQDVSYTELGSVEGLATYPSNGLRPAGNLTCRSTGGVSQAEVSYVCDW